MTKEEISALAAQDVKIDEVVTRLYRRFKDWNKRGFTADDVTWCEVRADVMVIVNEVCK